MKIYKCTLTNDSYDIVSGTIVWCTILLREKSCIFNSSLTALFQVALSETFVALRLTSSLKD